MKYRVNLLRVDSMAPVVEADSEDEAIDLAFEQAEEAFLCAQCSGYGKGYSVDEGQWALHTEVFTDDKTKDVEVAEAGGSA